jgi:hypothetical protein
VLGAGEDAGIHGERVLVEGRVSECYVRGWRASDRERQAPGPSENGPPELKHLAADAIIQVRGTMAAAGTAHTPQTSRTRRSHARGTTMTGDEEA